jgi:hypothetical protein
MIRDELRSWAENLVGCRAEGGEPVHPAKLYEDLTGDPEVTRGEVLALLTVYYSRPSRPLFTIAEAEALGVEELTWAVRLVTAANESE